MTTFRIYIDGQCDEVCAKHIKDGNFYVRLTKTGNRFGVKWISTFRGDYDTKYDITQFYEASPYANSYLNREIKVYRIK